MPVPAEFFQEWGSPPTLRLTPSSTRPPPGRMPSPAGMCRPPTCEAQAPSVPLACPAPAESRQAQG
eukprot:3071502-Pyramimonas_sp.AAC.1